MKQQPFNKLTKFLKQLEQDKIHYTLASHRDDAIMVLVTVPGERWEIEFLGDGSVEVERFISDGEICGEEALQELLTTHADHGTADMV
jgi:hypothetical protein